MSERRIIKGWSVMNQEQRDRLIERYTGRQMGPAEEREFLRLLDGDGTLRRMLRTECAVNAALLGDRDAIAANDLETRTHLLAALAAMPNPGDAPVGTAAGASRFFSAGFINPAIAVLAVCAITAVCVVLGMQPGPVAQDEPASH